MEALFFSALSCSFRRLHKAQGCWSLSYFCGFWSGSMFHWSSLSSPFLSNLCCRHVHGLYIHSQHCHTFHQSAVSPYKLSDFFSQCCGVHSFHPSLPGELSADQKEPEKTVCQHNNKGFPLSLAHLHKFSR